MGCIRRDKSGLRHNIELVDQLLASEQFEINIYQRSFALNCRAQSRHFLGDLNGALEDYNESIRLAPEEPRWLANRAQYWSFRDRPDLADEDNRHAAIVRRTRRYQGSGPDSRSTVKAIQGL
jgi:hypothetical protein